MQGASLRFVLLALMALAPWLHADQRLLLKFPWGFTAGDTVFAAGEYVFSISMNTTQDVVIQSSDRKQTGRIHVVPLRTVDKPKQGKLVFHRYEDRYFLEEIWMAGDRIARQATKGAAEQKLLQDGAKPEVVNVNLR